MFGACVALHVIIPKNHAREPMAAIVSRIRSSGASVILVFAVEQDAGALFDEALRHEALFLQAYLHNTMQTYPFQFNCWLIRSSNIICNL